MRFTSLVPIAKGTVVAVIGGGGKTGLLELLEEELTTDSIPSITAATTRLGREQLPRLKMERAVSLGAALSIVKRASRGERLLLAGPQGLEDIGSEKYSRIPTNWLSSPCREAEPDLIWLIEADGSAGRPIKAHRATEPVLPPQPFFLILVLGLSALTLPWPVAIHRTEIFETFQPLPETPRPLSPEEIVSFAAKAYKLLEPDIIFLNQADALLPSAKESGRRLGELLAKTGFRIVSGSLYSRFFNVVNAH
jgi:probable selenium-dependent hydroxylase accessory protein YqeC